MEIALLHAIQELPGRQRAVLIFRDVLGWTAPEVAELLDTTVASVNSALQRARATIDEHLPQTARTSPRADASAEERELLNRYVGVFERDDIDGLVALLHEDAVLRMPPQPAFVGGSAIASFFAYRVAVDGDLTRFRLTPTSANGRPAAIIHLREDDGELIPHGITVLETKGGRIVGIDAFIRAELVARFAAATYRSSRPSD